MGLKNKYIIPIEICTFYKFYVKNDEQSEKKKSINRLKKLVGFRFEFRQNTEY